MDQEIENALNVLKRHGREYAFFEKHYPPEEPPESKYELWYLVKLKEESHPMSFRWCPDTKLFCDEQHDFYFEAIDKAEWWAHLE